jgi:protein-tyrosine phosphatase
VNDDLQLIDLHCHVLPAVDDGPASLEAALALVRGARDDGIATIAATPHVDWSHPEVDAALIHGAVPALQQHLDAAGLEVTIVTGAEVAAVRAVELDDAELAALRLGGGAWLLLECPVAATLAPGFMHAARTVAWRGHRVLLAHPERCPLFLRSPDLLEELVAEGMLTQVTSGALSGRFGRTVRDFALRLVARGGAQVVASDGHDERRPARIAADLQQAGIAPALASWLAADMPAALLAGDRPPPRPQIGAGSRRAGLRRLVRR